MQDYVIDLTTLESVKRARSIANDEDDDLLKRLIRSASRMIVARTNRTFVPYIETRFYSPVDFGGKLRGTRFLEPNDDLLEVVELKIGATAVSLTDLTLHDRNAYPHWRIELKSASGLSFRDLDDEEAVELTAIWGYHPLWNRAFVDVTTLTSAITASATTFVVASIDELETLDLLKIGDEYMQIATINQLLSQVTVVRGINGTTASAHAAGTTISRYVQTENIELAAQRLTGFLYERRDTAGNRMVVADGRAFVDDALPLETFTVIRDLRREDLVGLR